MGYSSKEKGYKWFNPSTLAVRVSQDVGFDQSASWYELDSTPSDPTEEELEITTNDDIQLRPIPSESPISTMMSEPQETPSTKNISRPWAESDKSKGKMPEYEVHHPDDSDSDVSAR